MIGKLKSTMIVLSIALFFLFTSLSFAADIEGAGTILISSSAGVANPAETLLALGGNVTSVNINGSAVTDRWTGFFGNISGIVRLSDAAGNKFYSWTISVITGAVVYATNGTVSNWSSLAAANMTDMPSYLKQSASDNYTNTFTLNEDFTTNLRSVVGVNYTYTLNSSAEQSVFKTYALTTDTTADNDNSTLVFAGKAVQQENAFNDESVDFQILAPARTLTTYYFYLELP